MKILIVEDSLKKADQVATSLRRVLPNAGVEIQHAHSLISAVRCLEAAQYDLLILDLLLPIRDGDQPDSNGGRNVLNEVLVGGSCLRPAHIICLTAYEDAAQGLRSEAERSLVHVVVYKETDPLWKEALESKAQYVAGRLKDAANKPKEFETDIVVLTSSPSIELQEIIKLPGAAVGEHNPEDALDYYSAAWSTSYNQCLSVIACAAPRMGMTAACVTAAKAIERWRPRFLVMTGIAAATTSDCSYGDVLVAESAYDYGSGKILEQRDGNLRFIPSPHPLNIDPGLHALLQRWEREQLGMQAVQRAWYTKTNRTPQLKIGILATGAAVVQSRAVVEEILAKSRKVVGLDMEAYAVFEAAHLASKPRPRVLVAKSVADFANTDKTDDWQQYAAFTSARFVYEFFTNAPEVMTTEARLEVQ